MRNLARNPIFARARRIKLFTSSPILSHSFLVNLAAKRRSGRQCGDKVGRNVMVRTAPGLYTWQMQVSLKAAGPTLSVDVAQLRCSTGVDYEKRTLAIPHRSLGRPLLFWLLQWPDSRLL